MECRSDKTIVNLLYPDMQEYICSKVLADLDKQVDKISSTKFPSLLRDSMPDSLQNLDWASVVGEWKEHANILYCFVETVCLSKMDKKLSKPHYPAIGFAGSVMLFSRNPVLSRVQHAIGLVMDQLGATDEV